MTYAQFLLVFICPPLFAGIIYFLKSKDPNKGYFLNGILTLCALAFIWTTPWDNYLVANSVWGYGADRVLFVIGYVPIEEYSFFFLQTLMTGFYTYYIQRRIKISEQAASQYPVVSIGLLMVLFIFGVISLFFTKSFYLGLILAWAMPICLLQWLIGARHMKSNLRVYFLSTIPPTLYLWIADNYAITDGIWYIADKTILGFKVANLPLEEATFFLVTNMMVTQGLILFVALRKRLPEYKQLLRLQKREV